MNKLMMWLFEKLDGKKSLLGFTIRTIADYILQHHHTFPHSEFILLARWLGDYLLGVGLIHKGAKLVPADGKKK